MVKFDTEYLKEKNLFVYVSVTKMNNYSSEIL